LRISRCDRWIAAGRASGLRVFRDATTRRHAVTEIGIPDPLEPEIEIVPDVDPVPAPVEVPEPVPAPAREPDRVPA